MHIFLPELSLAFEYQGEPHYIASIYGSKKHKESNDRRKAYWAKGNILVLLTLVNRTRYYTYFHSFLVGQVCQLCGKTYRNYKTRPWIPERSLLALLRVHLYQCPYAIIQRNPSEGPWIL